MLDGYTAALLPWIALTADAAGTLSTRLSTDDLLGVAWGSLKVLGHSLSLNGFHTMHQEI